MFAVDVHGDIRHLEMVILIKWQCFLVHGDIRHLESLQSLTQLIVHGDIRHLEKNCNELQLSESVHGDIRHLEKKIKHSPFLGSWRHTPFRKKNFDFPG